MARIHLLCQGITWRTTDTVKMVDTKISRTTVILSSQMQNHFVPVRRAQQESNHRTFYIISCKKDGIRPEKNQLSRIQKKIKVNQAKIYKFTRTILKMHDQQIVNTVNVVIPFCLHRKEMILTLPVEQLSNIHISFINIHDILEIKIRQVTDQH